MAEFSPPWSKVGPASYFPSIEKNYGCSISEWQAIIAGCGIDGHMAIVNHLKSEYGLGHGHANALGPGRSPATSPSSDVVTG
jgi:hypothetical protein